jgi:hypothetical protein
MSARPPIPEGMKREVRQRCGFGCVVCGIPLYEYEHMDGYNETIGHVPEAITLLCDKHHKEKTNKLVTPQQVKEADATPHNFRTGVSATYQLHYTGNTCEAVIGSNRCTMVPRGQRSELVAIVVDNDPLVGFRMVDDHYLLFIQLFDDRNDLLLLVEDNELRYRTDTWDIEFTGNRLTLRERSRHIWIEISFDVPNKVTIDRGRLLCNGVELLVSPEWLLVTNNKVMQQGNSAADHHVAFAFGRQPTSAAFKVANIPRSYPNAADSIKWARAQGAG